MDVGQQKRKALLSDITICREDQSRDREQKQEATLLQPYNILQLLLETQVYYIPGPVSDTP